jgi:hypothetical protein
MERKQWEATAARNIRIRDLERKGIVQSRMGTSRFRGSH